MTLDVDDAAPRPAQLRMGINVAPRATRSRPARARRAHDVVATPTGASSTCAGCVDDRQRHRRVAPVGGVRAERLATRAKLTLVIQSFLLRALVARRAWSAPSPNEAFWVRCDETNNPPTCATLGQLPDRRRRRADRAVRVHRAAHRPRRQRLRDDRERAGARGRLRRSRWHCCAAHARSAPIRC